MDTMTEQTEQACGEKLALALNLRRDKEHRDRWATAWGSKTSLGLWRIVKRMVEHPEDLV